jgi:hypothetical protein
MTGILRVRRSRGVLSGLLLVLLGAWGALVPFVGPYFHYAYTPDKAWAYTTGRIWLDVLPGAATLLGGLIVLVSASRPVAHFGAWLAALSGAWFVLGGVVGPTWIGMQMTTGSPVGSSATRAGELIGFYTGLGVVIVLLAAMALGRFSVISVRDARRATADEPEDVAEDTDTDTPATDTDTPATDTDTPATTTTTTTGGWRRFVPTRKETTTETTTDEAADPASERVDSASAAQS